MDGMEHARWFERTREYGMGLVKERFTWDEVADQMINLYEKII